MATVRLNISMNDEVRDWYKVQAEENGMSMSALMSYILTQNKRNEELKESYTRLSMMGEQNAQMVDMFNKILEMDNQGFPEDVKN